MTEKKLKPLRDYTIGDFAAIGLLLALVVTAFILAGLVMGGVILKEPPPTPPTPTPISTPIPTPVPELLDGKNRRACGYLFTSFEWAVKQRDGRYENKYWFTNDKTVIKDIMTLRDGCYLDEEGRSLLWGDRHKPFKVMQFRLNEFGESKNDLKLYHDGTQIQP